MSEPHSDRSGAVYERLLRGKATSGEYVTALRAEARERVQSLRGADRVTDAAKLHGQGVDGGPVAPEPCPDSVALDEDRAR